MTWQHLALALACCGAVISCGSIPKDVTENHAACVNKGGGHSLDEQIEACTALVQSAYVNDRAAAVFYYNRGNGYFQLDKFAQARKDYDESIRLDPSLASAYFNRGVTNEALGAIDAAFADYGDAIRLNPQHATAFNNRGLVHLRRDENELALSDYSAAVKANPKLASALYGRGIARLRLGQAADGRADMAAATQADPQAATDFVKYNILPGDARAQ